MEEAKVLNTKEGNEEDHTIRSRTDGSSRRYAMQRISAEQKKGEDDADMHLACNIMQNKQFKVSTQVDDEYNFEDCQSRKSRKRPGAGYRDILRSKCRQRKISLQKKVPTSHNVTRETLCTKIDESRGLSDDLWETHIEHKWSKLVGNDAHHEWQWHTTKIINEGSIIFLPENKENLLLQQSLSGSCGTISGDSPFLRLHSYLKSYKGLNGLIRNYSKMALYICLETGRFCFPAQVYKATRFTLYCYDALVCYDSKTDTFRARSPNGGRHMIEKDIHWDRLRKPPHNTFLVDFYHSNCLNDLKPGDHIEIQKRRRRALPYCEWWYAVVCHLGSCDKDINHCSCRNSDTLVLEFNQYSHTVTYSLTRSAINSKVYVELTCLAGIRKLTDDEEIIKWKNLIFTRNQELRLAE